MSSANRNSYTSSFRIWMPFISVSCLIILARTSSTVLSRYGESGYSCLIPELRRNAFSLSPLNMILALVFFIDALFQVEEIPFYI